MSCTALVLVRQYLGLTPSASIARVPVENNQLSQWPWPATTTEPGLTVWPLCDPALLASNDMDKQTTGSLFIANPSFQLRLCP